VAHLGPITLHRAGRPGEAETLFREALRLRFVSRITSLYLPALHPDVTIVCSFGEIDCRPTSQHRWKSSVRAPRRLSLASQRTLSLSPSRSTRHRNVSFSFSPSLIGGGPDIPIIGSIVERAYWARALNVAIEERFERRGDIRIGFVDYWEGVVDSDGVLPESKSDGNVHLSQGCQAQVLEAIRQKTILLSRGEPRKD
jgi:hypothetical protein